MANWNYKLKSGKALRDAIRSEDNIAILNALKDCYTEINEAMPDWYDEDSLADDFEDIDSLIDDCENYTRYDLTLNDVIESIDGELQLFYDVCDDLKIWVEL